MISTVQKYKQPDENFGSGPDNRTLPSKLAISQHIYIFFRYQRLDLSRVAFRLLQCARQPHLFAQNRGIQDCSLVRFIDGKATPARAASFTWLRFRLFVDAPFPRADKSRCYGGDPHIIETRLNHSPIAWRQDLNTAQSRTITALNIYIYPVHECHEHEEASISPTEPGSRT